MHRSLIICKAEISYFCLTMNNIFPLLASVIYFYAVNPLMSRGRHSFKYFGLKIRLVLFFSGLASSQIASAAFTLGTTAVLPFYGLMVLAPKAGLVCSVLFSPMILIQSCNFRHHGDESLWIVVNNCCLINAFCFICIPTLS